MSTTTTTNMNLVLPIVGVRAGPDYANDINAAFSLVDSHDHSTGKGVKITPSGLNINAALDYNNNAATSLGYANYKNETATLSSSVLRSVYVVNGNLYYNNGSGTAVQITNGSSVAGASGTITGLTGSASASFSTPDFNFYFDSNKFGKANFSEYKLYEHNQASPTKSITLKVASGFESGGTSYSLTFPSTISSGYLTSNGSGTLSISSADAIGSAMTSTGSNAISAVRTRSTGTSVGAGGIAISNSSSTFFTSSTTYVDVTNLSVTITTSGRPVMLMLQPDGSNAGYIQTVDPTGATSLATIAFLRGAGVISETVLFSSASAVPGTATGVPQGSVSFVDAVAAGTYTYKVQVKTGSGTDQVLAYYCKLVAFEL